jgi:large subunit ribosomal protein L18
MPTIKDTKRKRRHLKIRAKVKGTLERPRLVVFKSLKFIYAQIINDDKGEVIVQSSNIKAKGKDKKVESAKKIGTDIAKKALEKKVKAIVFDRNGYKYHGRVKALAEGAREGGLQF